MGSPITTWEGAEAYFTGFGSFSSTIMLLAAVAFVVGAIVYGSKHETEAYKRSELE